MIKYYINGKEINERKFKVLNYLYNPLNHYAVVKNNTTFEWGRIPKLIIKRKDKLC